MVIAYAGTTNNAQVCGDPGSTAPTGLVTDPADYSEWLAVADHPCWVLLTLRRDIPQLLFRDLAISG